METSDHDLLRIFVTRRSEDAFRQMVDRHLNLVFATARRIVGDPQLAEEVAQGVFMLLARKAGEIQADQPLAAWLYHATRYQSLNASRAEGRRRQREQTALAMQTTESAPEPELITAELEGAMDELPPEDRDALVLRFLDNRQLRDVGTELGISEEAARKRVSRALEKLRGIFGKRGIAMSAGLLTTILTSQASAVAPAALGAAISATALSQLAAVSTAAVTTLNTTSTMTTLFNLKTAAVVLGVAAVTGTSTYLVKENEAERLQAEYQTLNQDHATLAGERADALAMIQLRDDQIARLRKDIADLPRLRGEIDKLNRKLSDAEQALVPTEELSDQVKALTDQNQTLTEKLGKSLTASWVFERDDWQNRGQDTPVDAFQTFLWAWNASDQTALKRAVAYPEETQTAEEKEEFLNRIRPREQLPATRATRVKVFWQEGGESSDQASLVAMTELAFVDRPMETREYLVRWDLVKRNGQWMVTRRSFM